MIRKLGGILGALVGDALGVPVEFQDRRSRDKDPVREMREFGSWNQPAGTWSDDGALLLSTLEGLAQGMSDQQIGQLYVRWMTEGYWAKRNTVFDIGGTTATTLRQLAHGASVCSSGATSESSNGNGSLMRILPVALAFHDHDKSIMVERIRGIGGMTHAHERSHLACIFYCLLVTELLAAKPASPACADAVKRFIPYLQNSPDESAAFEKLVSGRIGSLNRDEIQSSGYVMHTLEAAVWCLLNHDSFESTVLAAVNLGGDTDTTGCVVGGAAGVLYGRDSIPPSWLSATVDDALVTQIAGLVARCA